MSAALRLMADDLSGALDTLVRFAPVTGRPPLAASWERVPGMAEAWCSDSRDADEATAAERAGRAASWLLEARISLLKCDSRLRGHVPVELAACLADNRVARTVFAPSLPSQGRSFRDGRVYTRRSGRVPSRDDADMLDRCREVLEPADPARALRALGLATCTRVTGQPTPDGISLWDATTEQDLDRIVAGAIALPGKTLWCGSSGLAGALARHVGVPVRAPAIVRGPVLAIVGTRHPATVAQVSEVGARHPEAAVRVGPEGASLMAVAMAVNRALRRGESRCLTLTVPEGCYRARAATILDSMLADLVARLDAPSSCLVTGGATLQALVRILGASALTVEGELESGVAIGRLEGGRWAGVQVISKSGGFGNRSLLARILLDPCSAIPGE